MVKKTWWSILLAVLLVLVAACSSGGGGGKSGGSSSGPVTLTYIHGSSETSILHMTATHFKEIVERETNGRYKIEIYPAFQLGNLVESIEMIKNGDVELSGVILGANYAPELSFIDLPNSVPTIDAAYKLYAESSFRETVDRILRDNNIELLSFGPAFFREMTSNVPVRTIDDFRGINIRTLENPLHMEYWSTLGANPTPLAWSETYVGLQQGLVDAQENPYDSIYAAKLYEVQKYVINTHHILYTSPIMANKAFFDSLPAEDREIFRKAGKETEKYTFETAKSIVDDLKQKLIDEGMEVIDLPEETLNAMKEKAAPVYDSVRKIVGDQIMDDFLKALQEVQ